MTSTTVHESPVRGLHASSPHALSFAPSVHVRAFLLEREAGNVVVYAAPEMPWPWEEVSRHYLNHWHEAMFASDTGAPLLVHRADRARVAERVRVRGSFSKRHTLGDDFEVIPIPGHTPGATAYLWDTGERRLLFTGDTLELSGGEWVAAVLDSSDRDAYLDSLELIRELDFDVLVPWAAGAGERWYATTDPRDRRRRLDAVIARVRRGESR
jgi:glyoxylase-like metal-dependent hydrolase (beta-lactamase superfamily II)